MAIINGRIQRRGSRCNADINMTNLMDVMMVLLVVFMVAAPLMTSGIPLALPKVGGGTLNGKDTSINISVDKDGHYHIERDYTPQTFFETYIGSALSETVSIINAPTDDKPYHRTYTVSMLGNVVGGEKVCYLNLPIAEFKEMIIRQLKNGELVWFGSDVGKSGNRSEGIWDTGAFDYELLTGLDLEISKKDGLDYRFSSMGHAMVLTGVNLDDSGMPTRWKIENSWGSENGDKGYYVCSDAWFDRYVYQAVVNRSTLGDKAKLLDQEPIVLKPWDPMGSLAL